MYRSLLLGLIELLSGSVAAADLPFVNWENHPVHALDLSPDHRLLAAVHTADQRVQLFDVSSGAAVAVGHVVVGSGPHNVENFVRTAQTASPLRPDWQPFAGAMTTC